MTNALVRRDNLYATVREEAHRIMHQVLHRHKHVIALAHTWMRQSEVFTCVLFALNPQKVAVDSTRPMTLLALLARAVESVLNLKQLISTSG